MSFSRLIREIHELNVIFIFDVILVMEKTTKMTINSYNLIKWMKKYRVIPKFRVALWATVQGWRDSTLIKNND